MKNLPMCCLCLMGGLIFTAGATRARADQWDKKTYITTGQSIEVPGAVLPPGRYVFKLLDSPSNRHIVQVLNDRENHVYTTNLAIPKERATPADKTILTFYEVPGGGPEPVRAWFYPGDTLGQEFVYPRSRMEEIRAAMGRGLTTFAQNRMPARETENAAPVKSTEETPAAATPPPAAESTPPVEEASAAAPAPAPAEPQAAQQQPAAATPAPAETPAPAPAMPETAGSTIGIGLAGLALVSLAAAAHLMNRWAGSRP